MAVFEMQNAKKAFGAFEVVMSVRARFSIWLSKATPRLKSAEQADSPRIM